MALAVEIEKEFERIQSEQEKEAGAEGDTEVGGVLSSEEKVFEAQAQQDTDEPEVTPTTTPTTEPQVEEPTVVQANGTGEEEEERVESPRPQKQVSFGEVTQPAEEPKEFVLHAEQEQSSSREESESPETKAGLVALNREKFEKSSPGGGAAGGAKVKYSFAKKGGAPAVAAEEEPKESTVKNLRNFFQKLGSTDAEEGSVLKRPGVRASGTQNRRTMI